ncbi:MAG TPA: tripartite tricarboxylate transporter substrate binding protein [Casimicrobiaceae bacterium]
MLRLAILAALTVGSLAVHPADAAEPYPSKPVKLIVPQPPGGQSDVLGRMLGDRLAELWKEPVVVENHGGAGGTIGADLAAKAPADGYTVLVGGLNNLAVAPALVKDLRYDPIRDFAPVGGMARVPYALAVNRNVPATTLAELIAYARAHPGRLTYGSGGNGSMSSLGAELLKSMAGVDIVHVPYRGSAPSIKALVSGEIDMMFADRSLLAPHAKAGTLRLIAAAGAARASAAPELPTVAEQGWPGFAIEPWYGVVVPAGTPSEVVAKLAEGLHEILRTPEVRQRLEQLGYEPMADTPERFGALIRSETEKYAALIKRAGIHGGP